MLKSRNLILIFILGIIIIMLMLINFNVLILEDLTDKKVVFISNVSPNDEFIIKWMHSVELQPWEEIFRIDKNFNIILDRTRFKSFGAGVPDYAGNKTEVKDGYVIFSGIDKPIKDLQYRASNFAKHTFYFKDKELKLYELVGNENIIKIYTANISIIKYLKLKLAASV